MPVRGRLLLWGMYAVLLLGLVLMHHAPEHGMHQHGASSAVAASAQAPHAAVQHPVGHTTVSATQGCACPSDDQSVPPDASGLLHLCLATVAAAAALCVTLLVTRPPGAARAAPLARLVLDHLQPPLPVPRRLAALSVLRL